MFTMEQKVDLILRYIATTDKTQRAELKKAVVEALKPDGPVAAETPTHTGLNIDDIIDDVLKDLGMTPNLTGYDYVAYAIKLLLKDRAYYMEGITNRLYPDIAARFHTKHTRVERCIRHAITTTFDRADIDNITHIVGNTVSIHKGKLTNSEFLAIVTKAVDRRMREAQK